MSIVWNRSRAAALPSALLLVAWMVSAPALAQSAAENIQPVGQVCLAGQSCVGQPVAGSSASGGNTAAPATESAPAQTAPAQQAAPADPAPSAQAANTSDFDPEAIYNHQYCMACHMTGAANAPKLDDEEAWNTRLEKGMDAVMQNVLNGIGAMPARGL